MAVKCLVYSAFLGLAFGAFPLTILHTNDVHARFISFNERQRPCESADLESNKCWGGVARRHTAMKKFQSEDENVLNLDAGDQFQGTLWYTALKWDPIAAYMNVIKYDVMAFGNHEFDDGMQGLEPFVRNLTTPIVNSNIEDKGSPIKDLYNRKIIKEVGGQKIGIVGCTTTETPKIAKPGPELEFREEIRTLQPIVDELVKSGVNKIIVLSHSGFEIDKQLCQQLKNVDIVVGGHSHTFLWPEGSQQPSIEEPEGRYPEVFKTDGKPCLVVQDYAYGKYLGRLKVVFSEDGTLQNWTGSPVLLDAASFKEDEEVGSILRPYQSKLEHYQKTVVVTSAVELDGNRKSCRLKECNLGNVLADGALYFYVKHQYENTRSSNQTDKTGQPWSAAGIALWNSGGVRDFSVMPGEDIKLGDLYTIMPFQNTIDKITVKGLTLKQAFEHSVSNWTGLPEHGKFLQVSGIKVIYQVANPDGQKVKQIRVRCSNCSLPVYQPLEYDKIYDVVTHTYLSGGGDGYAMLRDDQLSSDKSNVLDTDVVLDYLKAYRPVITGEEMRIEFYEDDSTGSKGNDHTSTAGYAGTVDGGYRGKREMSFSHRSNNEEQLSGEAKAALSGEESGMLKESVEDENEVRPFARRLGMHKRKGADQA